MWVVLRGARVTAGFRCLLREVGFTVALVYPLRHKLSQSNAISVYTPFTTHLLDGVLGKMPVPKYVILGTGCRSSTGIVLSGSCLGLMPETADLLSEPIYAVAKRRRNPEQHHR